MEPHEEWRARHSIPGIVPGLIVIGIGVLFLLNNLNIVFVHEWWRYWPVILIAAGMVKLVDSPYSNDKAKGGVLVAVGALFLADNLGFINLSWRDYWPLVLIGAGLLMLVTRLTPPQLGMPSMPASGHEGSLNEYAVFGGVERKVTTDDFRGGNIQAMFGGVEIDLRRATMRGDSAAIDLNAMFGGIELKIPQNWIVVSSVAAIFGGLSNKTLQPAADEPGVKRLFIRGAAVFGGVELKN